MTEGAAKLDKKMLALTFVRRMEQAEREAFFEMAAQEFCPGCGKKRESEDDACCDGDDDDAGEAEA